MGKTATGKTLSKIFGRHHRYETNVELLGGLDRRGRLLDAGAREGNMSGKLTAAGFSCVAADICVNPGICRDFPWVQFDFNKPMPFQNETFEFVTTNNTLEYLDNPFGFIRECYRILNDNGMLLIEMPNILNLQARVSFALTGFFRLAKRPYDEVLGSSESTERRWNLKNYFQLRAMLHRNGFRIVQVTTHDFSNKAMLLAPLYLLVYLFTRLGMRKEKNQEQCERNWEIFRHVMSADLLFGKQLFIIAAKDPEYIR